MIKSIRWIERSITFKSLDTGIEMSTPVEKVLQMLVVDDYYDMTDGLRHINNKWIDVPTVKEE